MLREAISDDKEFPEALRKVGCKTRMRVRNKSASRELFIAMLEYLESGTLPEWMKIKHRELLARDDSEFDVCLKMEDRD